MEDFHKPVLLQEVIDFLRIKSSRKYIDATIGGGGHSLEILKRGGIVLGLDQDPEALAYIKNNFADKYTQLILIQGNFRNIEKIALDENFGKVAGIIFDLGVSSYQLNKPERGFSFLRDGVLDMRMDQGLTLSALDLINNSSYEKLFEIFTRFGEESLAGEIARTIIKIRRKNKSVSTKQFAEIIKNIYRANNQRSKIHPATKVFQALRIEVNNEMVSLKEGLLGAIKLLDQGGRLLVISYHSLEDRLVKLTFRKANLNVITKKPIMASDQEVKINLRARSAKLRVAEKL